MDAGGGTSFTPWVRNTVLASDDGTTANGYTWDPSGVLLAVDDSTTTWYPVADRQGSVLALVDASGTVGSSYAYGPWGTTLSSTGTDRSGYRWLGTIGYHTDDTGLVKAGARYYDPDLRRWTQPDPSALETNAYAYAGNNPCNNTDPSGLDSVCTVLAGAAGVGFALTAIILLEAATGPVPVSAGLIPIFGGAVVSGATNTICNA